MDVVSLEPGTLGRTTAELGGKRVLTNRKDKGIVVFGPYESRSPGAYSATFNIRLADYEPPLGDPVCLHVDVAAEEGRVIVREKFVLLSQLTKSATVTLDFDLHETRSLEYRVWTNGQVALDISTVAEIRKTGDLDRIAKPLLAHEVEWRNEREFLDGYLRNITGLIHIGANLGQERRYYWLIGLDVIWVEPIKEVYEALVDNIANYPRQIAYEALLTNRSGEQVRFSVASNNGASSSILPLQDHARLWPDVSYSETRTLISTTLKDLIADNDIPLDNYQALTLDVEGAEKMVLEGGLDLLNRFKYIKCEAADFPARTGTPTAQDLNQVLRAQGFRELARRPFAMGPGDEGTYWDIVWKRESTEHPFQESAVTLPMVMNSTEVEGIEKVG